MLRASKAYSANELSYIPHAPQLRKSCLLLLLAEPDKDSTEEAMVIVSLGEDVRTVRSKLGMAATDYQNAWRSLNVSRTKIERLQGQPYYRPRLKRSAYESMVTYLSKRLG